MIGSPFGGGKGEDSSIISIYMKLLFILFLLLSSLSYSQSSEVSMLFVGDIMQHDGQIEAAYNKTSDSYEYDDGFKYVRPIIESYDIRVANLEVTHAGKPYKGYPQFSAPDELSETLVNAGFNLILTANNHSCDGGSKGVIRTLDVLDRLGVQHTGTFRSAEERAKNYPLIMDKNGIKIAMLNYTYGTNGLSVAAPLIINYIDSAVIKNDVERAKQLGAEYIVCNMHWGTEYKPLPNGYQKRFESYCYDLGVDMVIGGHPHVVQPIEKKIVEGKEKLTVWSLGNFVSNMKIRYTRGGVMVGTKIEKVDNQIKIKEANYCLVYVHPRQEGATKQYYILPEFDYNSYRPDFLSKEDLVKMNEFYSDSRELYNEHNKGTTEYKVEAKSEISNLYQSYLTSYYSVMIPFEHYKKVRDEALWKYFHVHVDSSGNIWLLSGVYKGEFEARGNMNFIKDCGLEGEFRIVKITPSNVE